MHAWECMYSYHRYLSHVTCILLFHISLKNAIACALPFLLRCHSFNCFSVWVLTQQKINEWRYITWLHWSEADSCHSQTTKSGVTIDHADKHPCHFKWLISNSPLVWLLPSTSNLCFIIGLTHSSSSRRILSFLLVQAKHLYMPKLSSLPLLLLGALFQAKQEWWMATASIPTSPSFSSQHSL